MYLTVLDCYPVIILVPPLFTIYWCTPVCSTVSTICGGQAYDAQRALPCPGILGLGNPLFFILHMFKALIMCMSLIWKIILKMCSIYFLEPNFSLSESTFYTLHVTVNAALLTFCTWNRICIQLRFLKTFMHNSVWMRNFSIKMLKYWLF